jgi:hypothetical protein
MRTAHFIDVEITCRRILELARRSLAFQIRSSQSSTSLVTMMKCPLRWHLSGSYGRRAKHRATALGTSGLSRPLKYLWNQEHGNRFNQFAIASPISSGESS